MSLTLIPVWSYADVFIDHCYNRHSCGTGRDFGELSERYLVLKYDSAPLIL